MHWQATWSDFLGYIAPEYEQPSRQALERTASELSQEITTALREKLRLDGPWFLTADGATSKGQSLLTIDCANASDECFHLALVDGGYSRLDATWLKEQLKDHIDSIPDLAGLSQDTARTCKNAFRELHADLTRGNPDKWRKLSYIDCGEHVSQLLASDLAKNTRWLKDWASQKRLSGKYHFSHFLARGKHECVFLRKQNARGIGNIRRCSCFSRYRCVLFQERNAQFFLRVLHMESTWFDARRLSTRCTRLSEWWCARSVQRLWYFNYKRIG